MEKSAHEIEPRPRVGIGIMIMNDKNEVLLGLRQGSHGAGEWSFPGGSLEFGETLLECAKREVAEETGLAIDEFTLISIGDEMRYIKSDNKHFLNIGFLGHYTEGEPQVLEPNKCIEWRWFSLDQLPDQLFESTERMVRDFRDREIYRAPVAD